PCPLCSAAAACGVAVDFGVAERQRPPIVDAAAHAGGVGAARYRVVGEGAAGRRHRAQIVEAAAGTLPRAAGDGIATDDTVAQRQSTLIVDPAAALHREVCFHHTFIGRQFCMV